jgi:DnaJ-related protein SCJ1
VDIPPGAPEGWEYVFEGEADESPDWEAGDVYVRVRSNEKLAEQEGWRRKESGLYRREVIGVDEVRLQWTCRHVSDVS